MATGTITNALGGIRHEEHGGKRYIVAPGVVIRAGVLNGELLIEEEFGRHVASWEGRPLVIGHPRRGGQYVPAGSLGVQNVGYFVRAHVDNARLKGELWFDEAKLASAGSKGDELRRRLENNELIELSSAYFRDLEPTPGVHRGRQYRGIARNLRPDHVAILLHERGACSIADGCGVPRLNGASY